jgi:HK97 family phage portal protein
MEEGLEWQNVVLPQGDAQFIEQAKLNRTDIALLFSLPPGKLAGERGSSMTYANSESESLDFVKWTLRRWYVRIEKSVHGDPTLFPTPETHFPEFIVDALLRADTKTRYQAYALGFGKWLTTNDIRARENMNPVDDGDDLAPMAEAVKTPAPVNDDPGGQA